MPRRVRCCLVCQGRFIAATMEIHHCSDCLCAKDALEEDEEERVSKRRRSTSKQYEIDDGNDSKSRGKDDDLLSDEEDDDAPLICLLELQPSMDTRTFCPSADNDKAPQPEHPSIEEQEDDENGEEDKDFDDFHLRHQPQHDNTLNDCFVCGSSLTHIQNWKGRLNHVKRCSKKNAVTVKDVCFDNDHEVFVEPAAPRVQQQQQQHPNNPYLQRQSDWHADATVDLKLATVQDQGKENKATTNNKKSTGSNNSGPSLHNILMMGARRLAKKETIQQKEKNNKTNKGTNNNIRRGGWWQQGGNNSNNNTKQQGPCPSFKKIANTDIVVDGFTHAKTANTRNFFLTHFHSDHYGGISKTWQWGTIYCSLTTATLVATQLGVDRKYLHPLPMLTPTVISSQGRPVTVTLLDANHCPGAVMFLFQIGKRHILHVGDFRWNRTCMFQQAPLQPYLEGKVRLDDLFLDTTYCNPKYTFPTQDVAIQAVVETAVQEVQQAQRSNQRLLLLFGAYTIGKEAVYWAVADRLGQRQTIGVDSRRRAVAKALVESGGWSQDRLERLVTMTKSATSNNNIALWVVPMSHVTLKKLPPYLEQNTKFDRVVAFRPTGWSLNKKNGIVTTTRGRGGVGGASNVTIHSAPYSEHSSFDELVDCLHCLEPKRIIPTVNASTSQEQIQLLKSHLVLLTNKQQQSQQLQQQQEITLKQTRMFQT